MDNTQAQNMETHNISSDLAQRIMEDIGENVYLCYQCVKCTSGCPVAEFFDWQPNQIMRALQLGQDDIALESQTPWLCASCQTCTTRCPQGIDITCIMEFLTRESLARGYKPQVAEVNIFNIRVLKVNEMFNKYGKKLTKEQKKIVIEKIDKASTVAQINMVAESLDAVFRTTGRQIQESGSRNRANASRATRSGSPNQKVLSESVDKSGSKKYSRIRELAGLLE